MFKRVTFIGFLFFVHIQSVCSQGYVGKDFYLSNMEYFFSCFDTVNLTQGVYVTSPHAATVEFVNPTTLGPVPPGKVTLTPNKTHYFEFNPYLYPLEYFHTEKISNFSARLISDSDVVVTYAIQTDSFQRYRSKGSASILPVNSIPYGTEYIVTSNKEYKIFTCMGESLPRVAPQMILLGIAPLSRIEIIPKSGSTASNNKPLKPFYIELKQGETYYYVSNKKDLTGSIIRSKDSLSRFAVFAGDKLSGSTLPDSSGVVCRDGDDYGLEQMIPTVSWGNSYTALPFKALHAGYYLKVVSSQNNTRIYINGTYNRTLNEGEFFTQNVTTQLVTHVSADKPISVTQFLKGGSCANHSMPKFKLGDYEQLNLTADTFSSKSGWISTLSKFDFWFGDSLVIPEHYVNIICKTADTATIFLNGKKIKNSEWKQSNAIPGKQYAQIQLDSGNHVLNSVNPFNYYVYGYGDRNAHAYQGHSNTRPIHNNYVYDMGCRLDSMKFRALNTSDFYNFSWKFGDGSPALSGPTVKHQFKDTGWHNTVLYFQHTFNNKTDSVTKRIYIARAGPSDILVDNNNVFVKDTLVCGKLDLNVYVDEFSYDHTYLWSDKGTAYYKNFKLPGEHSIIVSENNTCIAFDTIRIDNKPFPTAVFNSTDTGFCESDNRPVVFFNKSYAPDSIVKNVWDFGILDFENNDSVLTNTFNRAGQYLVKLRVYSEYGCWHDTFQQFTIYPSPHPEFDVLNVDSCMNSNQVTFINRTVADTTLFQWFKWYFSEGYVISRSNPTSPRTYDAPGTYIANLIYTYNNGCFDTAKRRITIYENPKTDFKLANPVPCLGDSVRFTNLSTSPHTPLSYKWHFGDTKESLEVHPAHLYAGKGQYTVKLIAQSPQACKDSVIKSIFLNGSIRADFAINDTQQCFDAHNFKFSNQSLTDTGQIVSGKWQFSDGSSSTAPDSIQKQFAVAGVHHIQLSVVNSFGCKDSIRKSVRLLNNPKGKITVNQASQCENSQNFNFVFTPQYPGAQISRYKWFYYSDSLEGSTDLNNIKFPATGLHQVKVKTGSLSGCDALTNLTVSVNASPLAKFDIPLKIQCFSGHAFQIINRSSISRGQIKNYQWRFGDNSSSTLPNPAPKIYNIAGQYLLELQAESDSGCFTKDTASVNLIPKANIQIGNIAAVCLNDSTVFTANANGGKFVDVRWEFGDMNSASGLNTKHVYAKAGSYPVRLITNSGQNCIDTTAASSNAFVWKLPEVDFKSIFSDGKNENTLAKFTNTSRFAKTTEWDFESFGKSQLNDTTLDIRDSITLRVSLRISDQNGCYNTKTEYIFISGPLEVYIPNVFTPNNDGLNDGFGPVGLQFSGDYKFTIYNRWGEIMFESQDPSERWDGTFMGKLCPVGVYIYKLDVRDIYRRPRYLDGSFLMKW